MNSKPLTPERFDKSLPIPQSKVIWGLDGIGRRIGRSSSFVKRTLLKQPDSPIRKMGKSYCVDESELMDFFKSQSIKHD